MVVRVFTSRKNRFIQGIIRRFSEITFKRIFQMKAIFHSILFLFMVTNACGQEEGYIISDGFRLNYQVIGQGTPALVVGSSVYYARMYSENLQQHLKMVMMDHRGFVPPNGERDHSDYDLDKIIDDMEAVRKKLDLGNVIVIGHSGHSFMALEYAKKYPQNVSHVVMIGTAPDFGPENTALIDLTWSESVDPERKTALEENFKRITDEEIAALPSGKAFIRNYVRSGPMAWYDPHFDSTPLWEGVYINGDMLNYVWGTTFAEIDITKGLADLEAPVFLALGRYDYLVGPVFTWNAYRDKFPDLTIRIFEKSGHSPMYEEPEAFDRELLAWLESRE